MSAPDFLQSEFAASLRSLSCPGLAMSVMDYLRLGPPASLRSSMRFGSIMPALGRLKPGLPMPVPDPLQPGPSSPPRSFARMELPPLVSDFLHMESLLLLHPSGCPESSFSLFGLSCLGSLSSLPATEGIHPGFLLSLQTCARLGVLTPATDFSRLGSSPSMRSLSHLGSSFPILRQKSLMESPLPPLDFLQLEVFLPTRSFARLGFLLFVLDFLTSGLSLLARMPLCIEPALPASGKFSFGSSSVSVLGKVYSDPFMPAHSPA